jgi:hypothetical protein
VSKEELTPAASTVQVDGADGGTTSPVPTEIVSLRGPPRPVGHEHWVVAAFEKETTAMPDNVNKEQRDVREAKQDVRDAKQDKGTGGHDRQDVTKERRDLHDEKQELREARDDKRS